MKWHPDGMILASGTQARAASLFFRFFFFGLGVLGVFPFWGLWGDEVYIGAMLSRSGFWDLS